MEKKGGVAKWSKATVCKTVIHGFESHRRLFVSGKWRNMVYAQDLKSWGASAPCGFESRLAHF